MLVTLLDLKTITFFAILRQISCFIPENSPNDYESDFTQREIVSIAIINVLHGYETFPSVDDLLADENLMEMFRNSADHVEFSENTTNVRHIIDELVDLTTSAGPDHTHVAECTFSNEQIHEGHTLMHDKRHELVNALLEEATDVRLCRKLLGEIFHLVLSFYSNTNWVELYPNIICTALGIQATFPYKVAESQVPTCSPCSNEENGCEHNLLVSDLLTSGYWDRAAVAAHEHPIAIDQDPSRPVPGKCRHGGIYDGTLTEGTVKGGINKMSGNPTVSPHHHLHARTALLAILHCRQFLVNTEFGLSALVGQEKVLQLLGIFPDVIYVYIDAPDVTLEAETLASLIQLDTRFHLMKRLTLNQACAFSHQRTLVIIRIQDHVTADPLPDDCLNGNTNIFHIIPHSSNDHPRWKRASRTTVSMNLYNIIAQVSGGSVYHTTKSDIGAVVDLIKETVSAKPPVSIMKFVLKTRSNNTFTIPVDELIGNVTIKIQATSNKRPAFDLFWPNGTRETYSNPKVATKQILGTRLVVVKLINATAGLLTFTRTSSVEYEVEISAKTDLDFTYKFMQPGPGGYGEYPLIGRPIAGAYTSVQVSVPLYDQVDSVDGIVVLDDDGTITHQASLHNIGGRHGKSLFKTHIIIPLSEFKLAIEGRDKSNNLFRRLDPRLISTLAIKLEVLGVSGTLYVNGRVTLTYRVTNVGGASTQVVVKISDDKGFSQSPVSYTHTLASHQNVTGSFRIVAGSKKGETVTLTVSANIRGAPANKVQYSVQRLTVEENITRAVDNESPMCNVTKVSGTCDIGTDLCACVNKTWHMEAVLGDVGFGLQSVFVSGAGNNSMFKYSNFVVGHTVDKGIISANLSADCCHQHATITVVDLAGNVGLCNVTITPNFVAPDAKLCENPTHINSNPSNGSVTIPCNATQISGPCDFRNINCTGDVCAPDILCANMTWKMHATIGNHSYAIHQIIPVNVGKSAQLLRNNDSLDLVMDCCHTSAYINIIDIAGNVGQCHANTTVIDKPVQVSDVISSTDSASDSIPIPIIAGAAGGGIVLISASVVVTCIVKKHMANKVESMK